MLTNYAGTTVYDDDYLPDCDITADGTIDGLDVMMATTNMNLTVREYPGGGDVDYLN